MKIDPYKHQQKYENWKKKEIIKGASKFNSDIIVQYLNDMENGFNVSRKRSVGYARLNNLKQRMRFIVMNVEKKYGKSRIVDITDREIVVFFKDMREGRITTRDGTRYTSVADYASVFKAFWHWYQRIEAEKGNVIKDVTTYIDMSPVKESSFVYFTIENVKKLADRAKYEYKILMWFLFDTGIRAPTELMNVRVADLSLLEDKRTYQLDIRDEVSKTFGRKIKLLLCSKMLKEYISDKGLTQDDYLFPIVPRVVNQYLQRLGKRVMGDIKTKGGKTFEQITMYDFRHSSACYWLPRYKNESALKYRFGWKKNEMIHHYTKLLGMRDTIVEEDLMLEGEAKTKLEKDLDQERKIRTLLEEQLQMQREEMMAIKNQLVKSQERDVFILKMLQVLHKEGKIGSSLNALRKGGVTEDLITLK